MIFYVFCTVHCDTIMQHKPTKCTLFKLILSFNFWRLLHVSNLMGLSPGRQLCSQFFIWYIDMHGSYEPEINDKINWGRAAITELKSILWDRDVTPKTKTHICYAVVKSTITYAAETWCLKAKNGSKTKFHRNGLLATIGSNFQEGQN